MSTITTRSGKGSPLTNNEVDANFTNLNTDKLESADLADYATLSGATFTGEVEATGFNGDLTGAILFKGQAGEALTKGDPVYISGISGNKTVVSKADANDANKMPCFGIVDATVSANADCSVVTFGTLQGLDTSSFSEGDELFVSDTGTLTTTAPTGESSQIQKISKVTRSHASTGSIKVMGAGRTNAVPNLNDGQFFLGNGSNQAVSTDFTASVLGEISAGTGIGISASGVISNSAPDQTVSLTGAGTTTVSGTYPTFTITGAGTTYTAGTGITLTGTEFSIGQSVATTDSPTFTNLTLSGTDSVKVPSGTTGQRNGSPANGMFRYNSTTAEFEGYQDGAWGSIGGGSADITLNQFTGDGSDTTFTLSGLAAENNTFVYIDGVYQSKDNYTVSAADPAVLTFSTAPPNTTAIEVMSAAISVSNIGTPSDNTVSTAKILDGAVTPAKIASGDFNFAKSDQTNGATLSITNSFNGSGWDAGDILGSLNFKTDDTSTTQPIRGQIKVFEDSASGTTYPNSNAMSFSTGLNNDLNERLRITSAGVVEFKAGITEDAVTLTGTSTTIDLATATNFVHDLTGNTTYTFSNPASTGNATAFTLKIIQDSTARTITWPASVDWAGGTAPTLTATNNGVDVFVFYTIDGGTTYYGFTAGQAMA